MKFANKLFTTASVLFGTTAYALAQDASVALPAVSEEGLSMNTILAICVAALLLVIVLIAFMLKSSIDLYRHNHKNNGSGKAIGLLATMLIISYTANAQEVVTAIAVSDTMPQSQILTWVLLFILGIEILIIFYLIKWIKFFTGIQAFEEKERLSIGEDGNVIRGSWWDRFNHFRSMKDEEELEVGHSYDGIKELDNSTPPWFTWSFAASVLVAVVYLFHNLVSGNGINQYEEYTRDSIKMAQKIEAYMKAQGNSIDENTVEMLDQNGIAAGEKIYKINCVACHGDKGQGGIGPNLTDEYWIHKGGIKDIFKSVKYGWPDKGMQSWKDQLSPMQIAQVTSFVKSLKGTNPPNAKEPQGEIYVEETSTNATDSVVVVKP